ncbi:hypothetical protein V5O48_009577 [Marasmius crinis-equi]|uniref:Uncharacterized protein n=1 Tax=Marasmius crinis-equi TaxID=585013 RepID=A0ABR3FAT8_9AGAR
MSIVELYQATSRAFARTSPVTLDISDADRAFIAKLGRAAARHELIAGVKALEGEIKTVNVAENRARAEQHEREAKQLIDGKPAVEEQLARPQITDAQSVKRHWSRLVKSALQGRRAIIYAPTKDITRWNWYESSWSAIQKGQLRYTIPFNDLPWPTLNLDRLELEDYETFILSPARPRFETLYWFERLKDERRRWDVGNVREKVIPLVSEDSRERVMGCVMVLHRYLDLLANKYK